MKTKTLHQSVLLKATAHDIYEALMDSNKHSEFTRSPAVIHREVGGEFSAFDGWASRKTVELIPDKKIVQKWRGADWPQGHYSTVMFELQAQGHETRVDFSRPISLKIFLKISKLGGSNGIRTTWLHILAKHLETGQAVRCSRTTTPNPTS